MNDLASAYSELIALTQCYLLQEHPYKEWLFSDPETFQFFKTRAIKARAEIVETARPAPAPVPIPPPKPIAVSVPPVATASPKPLPAIASAKTPPKSMATPASSAEATKPLPAPQAAYSFVREPLDKPKQLDINDIRNTISERLPQVKIVDTPPAPKSKVASQARVVLLNLGETGEELLFLHNVASAIDRLLMPAELLSLNPGAQETEWSTLLSRQGLDWIIAFGDGVYTLPGVAKDKEIQNLASLSLLHLPAIETLLRDPERKTALWKRLKELLK